MNFFFNFFSLIIFLFFFFLGFFFFFFFFVVSFFLKIFFVDFFFEYFNCYNDFNKLSIKNVHITFFYYFSLFIVWYQSIIFTYFNNFLKFFSFTFFFSTLYKIYVPRNYLFNEFVLWLRSFSLIEIKAEDDPDNYAIYCFFFDHLFIYLSASLQFKFRIFFVYIIYFQYTLIFYFYYFKYSFYYLYICWTKYRYWIIIAFRAWIFFELIFLGYCFDCIKLKIVKFYYRKTSFLRISSRKKRLFRFFWFVFSDYFLFLESFFKKIYKLKLNILKYLNKAYKYREEVFSTVIWHIEIFNRRIKVLNKQIELAQHYIDFFEQRFIIFKFLTKENLKIKVKSFKNRLKFKNLEQAILYKKAKEKKKFKFLRARYYFLRGGHVLSMDTRPIRFEMKLRKAKDKSKTLNNLMRSLFIKKLKLFFYKIYCFILVIVFDLLKFFYRFFFFFFQIFYKFFLIFVKFLENLFIYFFVKIIENKIIIYLFILFFLLFIIIIFFF